MCPDGGRQSTNKPQNFEERDYLFESVPTQMSFIRSVGLDKKIIDILWIVGHPRNTKKQKVSVGNLGVCTFCTSTLTIEIFLAPRGQNKLNFNILGSKNIIIG